ncbi:ArsR family transcriptional regulator [Sorangium sp. So ce118]
MNALLERPHCAEELAERLGRAPSTVSFHLRKLDHPARADLAGEAVAPRAAGLQHDHADPRVSRRRGA